MTIKYKILLTIFIASTLSGQVSAKENSSENKKENPNKEEMSGHENTVFGAGKQSVTSGINPSGIEFNVDGDASSVSAVFAWDSDRHSPGFAALESFRLKLTAPINKSTKRGNFITNDGFVNNFGVNLSWSRLQFKQPHDNKITTAISEAIVGTEKKCEQERPANKCINLHVSTKDEDKKFVEFYNAQLEKFYREIPRTEPAVWYYGMDVGGGYQKHSYRNPVDASKLSDEKISYSLAGFAGVTPNAKDLYLGGGFKYAVSYEDADALTRCGPPDINGFLDCITAPFSSPKKNKDSTVFALARYRLNNSKIKFPFAVEIKAAYDFEDNVFAIAAPLYLFSDTDSKLRGGVRIDWNDDDNDVTAGIFVGSNFNLFKNN